MDIKMDSLFCLNDEEISRCKVELNTHIGIEAWLSNPDYDKENGCCEECSYWGGRLRSNYDENDIVFSFIQLGSNDEWLLVSAARIINAPKHERAKVEILDRYKPFFGRLVMKYKRKQGLMKFVLRFNYVSSYATIKEILPCLYSGRRFEGYDKVHLSFQELQDVIDGKIMPTFHEALKKITGVYCLTNSENGLLYIGSAYGEEGVAQRWRSYRYSKHGGNKKLMKLYDEKGEEYFKKYFSFTLLEYFSLSYDIEKIIEREQYWKECLDTKNNGYNDN